MRRSQSTPAWKRAGNTDRWTEILFRALASRVAKRWRFVSFRGIGGREWRGVVDVITIRKDTSHSNHELLKSGDLFDIILIQMKGGRARRPSAIEIQRLMAVAKRYRAKGIVLFAWKRGESCDFYTLTRWGSWILSSAMEIFG
jgi:hypothetical protein